MRRILLAGKEILVVIFTLACAVFAFVLTRMPVFVHGSGYEVYYEQNSSANCARTQHPLAVKLMHVTAGESVRYAGDCYEHIKEEYKGELVFCEEAAGVRNYYLYSPLLGAPVDLDGRLVNLHVAVSSEQTAVGTPLIFGGY